MQKFDRSQIIQLKKDAIKNEKLKNRKKIAIVNIQRFFRGYIARKRFSLIIEEVNKNIIIEYFREKRKNKIRQNFKEVIVHYLNRYINRKREEKRIVLKEYLNYCVNIIKKNYLGFKLRKKLRQPLSKILNKKEKIISAIISYKARLILRTNKIQDILIEIANIQSCLNSADSLDNKQEDNLEKDFQARLPKLYTKFYVEYNKMENNKMWISYNKTNLPWMDKFKNIKNSLKIANTNSKKEEIKIKVIEKEKVSPTKENEVNNTISLSIMKNEKEFKKPNLVIEEVAEITLEEKPVVITNNSNIQSPRESLSAKVEIDLNDRPIKVNPTKMLAMLEEYPEETENETEKPIKADPKKKSNKPKPKYDARKAIEDAAKKVLKESKINNKSAKGEERDAFRKFLKEMRDQDHKPFSKEKTTKNNSDKKNTKTITSSDKKTNDYINTAPNLNLSTEKIKIEEESSTTRRKKVIVVNDSIRKKLHELEKSPPPKVITILI